jgi:hypothetical protein
MVTFEQWLPPLACLRCWMTAGCHFRLDETIVQPFEFIRNGIDINYNASLFVLIARESSKVTMAYILVAVELKPLVSGV